MIANFNFSFDSPFVCTAIHNGNKLREFTKNNLKIDEKTCLREEDPYTDYFTKICNNRIIANYSRFEVDLNRKRENCIYKTPDDAWGLSVRINKIPENEILKSLELYDFFYYRTKIFMEEMVKTFKKVYVFDFHSYNHNRKGIGQPFDNPIENPEIIIGTNNLSKKYNDYVKKVHKNISQNIYIDNPIDVRINVKYPGGHFSRWLHNNFPNKVICLSIEFKKIFMNEWTGELNKNKQRILGSYFASLLESNIFQF